MSGIDVTREVKKRQPSIEILIFTIFDEEDKVVEAIKAGAAGYMLTPEERGAVALPPLPPAQPNLVPFVRAEAEEAAAVPAPAAAETEPAELRQAIAV